MNDLGTYGGAPYPLLLGAEWVGDHTGGLNRYFADLAHALNADGGPDLAATVIGPAVDAPNYIFPASSVDTPLPRRLADYALQADKLVSAVDVIDVHFALYGAAALLHRRTRRRSLVVHFHGPWADESTAQRGSPAITDSLKRQLERSVYRRADRIIVLSAAFRDLVVDRYGVDPTLVEIVAPGVDLSRFTPGSASEARDGLGIDHAAHLVVSPRRLVSRMGLDHLIRAWARLDHGESDRLVIIGEGPERQRLERLAADVGMAASVRFTGRVSDGELVEWYRAADLLAVPSIELEGYGLVVLEAAACGTPAIATDVGGLGEAARGLSPELVVTPGDDIALANGIEKMRRAPAVSSEECRAHAERHSWAHAAAKHREIYADVVQSSAPVPRRPKVAVLTHSAELAGAEIAAARLGSALVGRVDVLYLLGSDGPLCDELDRRGLAYEVVPLDEAAGSARRSSAALPGKDSLLAAWRLLRHGDAVADRLRMHNVDLVQTSSLKAHVYGARAARKLGVPLSWYLHDRIDEEYLPKPAVIGFRQLARRTVDGVMANSHASLQTLPGTTGLREVVGCPIESPERTEAPRPDRDADFVYGIVGRLAPWKGQKLALTAFASAFRGQQDTQCRVIGAALFGEDDYEAELRALVVELGIADQVEFRGHCNDMASEYAEIDVAVHASVIPEPFGLVVVEAQAHGVPIIASAAGGVLETVEHDVDGLLFAPGSPESLAEQMGRIRKDSALVGRLVEHAHLSAMRFSPVAVADEVERFYRGVIERASSRW